MSKVRCCQTCISKKESFNLFWCDFHKISVAADEVCDEWDTEDKETYEASLKEEDA